MKRVARTITLCVLLSVVFGLLWLHWNYLGTPLLQSRIVKVYPGDSLRSLANRFYAQGLIQHPEVFEWYGRLKGDSSELKPGEYQIWPNDSMASLLSHIVDGDVLMRDFQIIEGWTFRDIRQALQSDPHLVHKLKDLSDEALMKKLGSTYQHPEGLLFPDTYAYTWGDSDVDIVTRAYQRMQSILQQQWPKRAADLPYKSEYQALIVASMIEKETALDRERAEIAGVILRRLKIRMRLQVDPTVVYGMGKPYGTALTRTDLKTPTPYNTYTNYGLPPTPIDMPSLASIVAALHPKEGTALYYVARTDGSHTFSDTYMEHRAAVSEYRQSRKQQQ